MCVMQKGKDIVDELREIAPGAVWPDASPLSGPPAGYFDGLPEVVLQRARMEKSASVQDELDSLSPLLAGARKQQAPYSVPEGYFEALPGRIISGVQAAPVNNTPVVPLRPRRNIWKWAAAACLAVIVGGSALFFMQRSNNSPTSVESQLAGISDQEIVDYLQTHSDAFDSEDIFSNVNGGAPVELSRIPAVLNELPADVIRNYIENTGFSTEGSH
jgi:hypothetical protein